MLISNIENVGKKQGGRKRKSREEEEDEEEEEEEEEEQAAEPPKKTRPRKRKPKSEAKTPAKPQDKGLLKEAEAYRRGTSVIFVCFVLCCHSWFRFILTNSIRHPMSWASGRLLILMIPRASSSKKV
jgi:hypothetical protein